MCKLTSSTLPDQLTARRRVGGGLLLAGLLALLAAPAALLAQEPAAADAVAAAADAVAAAADAAAEAAPAVEPAAVDDVNTLWTCLAAFLVFFMQAGFALVETGLTRAKNACNILMKNLFDFSVGSIMFWAVGFGLMFGTGAYIGTNGFFFDPSGAAEAGKTMMEAKGWSEGFSWAFLLFQTVFCATAATIVSGAMAERTKFGTYLIFSTVMTALIYPVFGNWAWGNLYLGEAWLASMGFVDFAGSTVVHSIGGWAALAGAIVVGPRLGKFRDGKVLPIPGHSLPLAALGAFILWLGWFGFNPGSTTAVGGGSFALISVTTNIAAAGGSLTALATTWILFKKPDPSLAFNGALAGLVAITAGCAYLSVGSSLIVGCIAGVVVVLSVVMIDKLKIDDPVGAVSVHGVCGAWGTLAVGLFEKEKGLFFGGGLELLGIQALGVAVAFAWAFPVCLALFYLFKVTIGVRVPPEDEIEGLDLTEHGMEAYPNFAKHEGRDSDAAASLAYSQMKGAAHEHGRPLAAR